jgi:hypothetical protein
VASVFVTALCLVPFVNAQTNDGAVLTLDQALLLAKSTNRDLKLFGLDVGKQREALGEAKTHLYPRFDTFLLAAELLAPLDFTIQKGQFGTYAGTGPIPGANTDLHTPHSCFAFIYPSRASGSRSMRRSVPLTNANRS